MGFFSFLQPVEHAVGKAADNTFHFLSQAVPGVAATQSIQRGVQQQALKQINTTTAQLPAPVQTQIANSPQVKALQRPVSNPVDTIKNLAVATVRAPLRAGATVGKSIADITNPALGLPKLPAANPASNPISEALLGKEPIKSFQQRESETQSKIKSTVGNPAGPLAFLGTAASIGLDATPLGKGASVTKEGLDQLAKATTEKEVRKIMEGTPQAIIDKVAPAIAQTKDPGVIDNILTRATTPDVPVDTGVAPPVTPPETPATEPASSGPKERGYTTSQKAADQYSPELKAAVGGKYRPAGDKPAVENANNLIETQGVDKTHQQVLEKFQSASRIDKQDIINAGTVISHLDSQGRTAEAEQLHELVAQRGTEGGQTSQALGVLLRRSPEGLVYSAKQAINKAQGEITPEVQDKLNNFKENIKNTEPGSPERTDGVTQLKQFVAKQIPASTTDKAFAIWRAGLLTGPQTVAKIVSSHLVHSGLEILKNVPGAAVDKFVSLFTGQRSLVNSVRGSIEGGKQGVAAGKELLTTGIDRNPGTNASELHQTINFGSSVPGKIAQAYVDFVGHVHGSLYKPFYGSAHLQSLYNQALAAAKTAGVKGAEKENFLQDFVGNPSTQALDIAKKDAETATFQQETALGNVASAIQKKGGIIGKVVAPFTRIPSAIATDLINYSPVGLAKTLIDGIKTARSDVGWTVQAQREFSQGVGRGLTGSAAIIPGLMLFNKGSMTLDYPTDPKEQKLWQLEGKIPNAVKIDGQWRSLGSIGPAGSVLAIGGHMAESLAGGNDLGSALISGFSGGLRSIEEQSYLQGISGALDATNDPGRYAPNFIKSEVGSVVPTISNTVAAATDQYSRQTNSPLDAIKGRIPGARETLNVKTDSLGNPIKAPETGIEKLIDPFQSSTVRSSPVVDELQRLQDANQGILPATINKKITFSGINTKISTDQQKELSKVIGQETLKRWAAIISNPAFQNQSDQLKSARLKSAYDIIAAHQKIIFAKQNKVGRYSPNYATNRKQAKANKKFVATSGG